MGKHIILIGPPGTGKTSLAQMICAYIHSQELSTGTTQATATADWSSFDTVGGYIPNIDQTLQFRPGIVLRSISAGHSLIIDEINRAEIDKAFGELFTVLSGQQVDLPYHVGKQPVRILPPTRSPDSNWMPVDVESAYDYVIHPNWRILGTMNVYDKSSLFAMSLAFMRRFAFVDIDLPDKTEYGHLISQWMAKSGLSKSQEASNELGELLARMLQRDTPNALMDRRALGPAIIKDMVFYIADRHSQEPGALTIDLLVEAFLLYAVPQLDGLDFVSIHAIHCFVETQFSMCSITFEVLRRIKALYPHVPLDQWPSTAADCP